MAFRLWPRREKRQFAPEPFVPPYPGADSYGRSGVVTTLGALQSSAVWACVRLIASSVSMMPLQSFTLRNGVRVPTDTPSLFKQPAADTTTFDWVYMIMVSLLLRGNAYGRIVARDSSLYPTQIELLSPDLVSPRRETDGSVGYYYKNVLISSQELFHARAYRMPGLDVGLSPIQYAALNISRDQAIQQFSLGYFQDAPQPASVLTSDQPVTQTQALEIKERITSSLQGRQPLVLGAGLKFTPLAVSPEESQFLTTQEYGAAEIGRFFGVPAQKIPGAAVGGGMQYSSVEMSNIDLMVGTIQWWLSNLESTFQGLLPGQQHVRFDPSVLLRTDLSTLMTASAIGIASKQMTPDEARALRDQPPLTDAQKALLALVPLEISPTGKPKALPPAPDAAKEPVA